MGTRKLPFTREVFIEKDDFSEDPPEGKWCLKPGGQVRLKYAYVITCKDVVKNKAGEVIEVRCTHDANSKESVSKDVKGVIQWVSGKHGAHATVRLYNYLINPESTPEEAEGEGADEDDDVPTDNDAKMAAFLKSINPQSLVVCSEAKLERSLADAAPMERFQFERNGYFIVDKYSKAGAMVFNRTLGMTEKRETRSRAGAQAKAAAEKEAKKKVDPKDMFRSQPELYSKFDADGIPTHDQAGEPLSKAKTKKLKAEWEKQKKLFGS